MEIQFLEALCLHCYKKLYLITYLLLLKDILSITAFTHSEVSVFFLYHYLSSFRSFIPFPHSYPVRKSMMGFLTHMLYNYNYPSHLECPYIFKSWYFFKYQVACCWCAVISMYLSFLFCFFSLIIHPDHKIRTVPIENIG